MKKFATGLLLFGLIFALTSSKSQAQYYEMGKHYIGANLTFITDPIGFGVDYEYGLTENISIGGILRYWGKSEEIPEWKVTNTLVMPQIQGLYHFTPKQNVDPYAGARLGYGIYSSKREGQFISHTNTDDSGLFLTLVGGSRYYFTPKISGNANIEFKLAGSDDYFEDSFFITVGIGLVL
jgi:hypothetical protein